MWLTQAKDDLKNHPKRDRKTECFLGAESVPRVIDSRTPVYSMAGCLPSLYDAQGSNLHFQKILKKIITEPSWIDGDVNFASD